MKPLCFVLMPFGKKNYQNEVTVDFDAVYEKLIKPAILAADMEPIRADEEKTDGIIHKPMFERLVLCEYAVADLSTANANVFYELGIRHAAKEKATVMVFANSTRLPFDVALLRAFPYQLDEKGNLSDIDNDLKKLTEKIKSCKTNQAVDSPLYQLLDGYPNIAHAKTDVFRDTVNYSRQLKDKLFDIRSNTPKEKKLATLAQVEIELGSLLDVEAGVVIDLFLSYRSLGTIEGFQKMIDLTQKMSPVVSQTTLIQEQLGFALNRIGKRDDAEKVLTDLIGRRGANSEVYGILGRVFKDQWEEAYLQGRKLEASGYLKKAIETYLKGFNTDWRDAYPGVNAVTLMTLASPEDIRWKEVFPVVRYAVEQKMKASSPDYWDYATMVELSVIEKDWAKCGEALGQALASVREIWEPQTTAKNIRYIKESRKLRNENIDNETEIEKALTEKSIK